MAIVKIEPIVIKKRNDFSEDILSANEVIAVDATDGAYFEMKERDDKYIIIVKNTATAEGKVTILKGNGIQGVFDLDKTIAASSTAFVVIDSGNFKHVSGDNKGKVLIKGSADTIKIAVIEMA